MREYYVYEHWDEDRCFWVGSGSLGRARSVSRSKTNSPAHRVMRDACVAQGRKVRVEIVKKFENNIQAFSFEEKLTRERIAQGHPIVNKNLGSTPSDERMLKYKEKREAMKASALALEVYMTPEEFKKVRDELGYTQAEFADALGIQTTRTIQRYEAGDKPIPKIVVLLLKSVGAVKG